MKTKNKTKKAPKLTAAERRLDYEPGWNPLDNKSDEYRALAARISQHTAETKEARITARINGADLARLKERAAAKGLPYQTLLGSILHLYLTDQLIDADAAERAMRAFFKKKRA